MNLINKSNADDLLSPDEAVAFLRGVVQKTTLAVWRSRGLNLPFIRAGRRILYRKSDLNAFLRSRTVAPVSVETKKETEYD